MVGILTQVSPCPKSQASHRPIGRRADIHFEFRQDLCYKRLCSKKSKSSHGPAQTPGALYRELVFGERGRITQYEEKYMKINMREFLEAGVHFGHQTRFWNPKMKPYIYGERQRIHIINLEHTVNKFQEAMDFLSKVVSKRGRVLFVGTKKAAEESVMEEATRAGMPYINHRWLGGMLTNYKTVRQSIKRLKDLEKAQEEGAFDRMIKKEALAKARELKKLNRSFGGIKAMNGLPDAIFVIDSMHEKIAISEANRLGIPVVSIVDTNGLVEGVNYLIPGNDDAIRAIRLYLKLAADAILEAKKSTPVQPDEIEAAEKSAPRTPKASVAKRVLKAKPETIEFSEAPTAVDAAPVEAVVPSAKPVPKKPAIQKASKASKE